MQATLFVRDRAEALARETGEHATEFELMCAVAFEHFARRECDVVVCEVGLGGRLDSTNVIEHPELCVITRIGLDHTALLGDTIADIAREKAGIVKPGAAVVSWPQEGEALKSLADAAHDAGVELILPDFSHLEAAPSSDGIRRFGYRGHAYETKLLGSYQPANAALAIEATKALAARGWRISEEAIEQGIARTTWPGRFEVIARHPPFVIDGGHNEQGAQALADSLRDVFPGRKVVFIMSVLADKDYRAMIRAVLPLASAFACVEPPNPRSLGARELAQAVREECDASNPPLDIPIAIAADYRHALALARSQASEGQVICAFGSLYALAAIREALAEGNEA